MKARAGPLEIATSEHGKRRFPSDVRPRRRQRTFAEGSLQEAVRVKERNNKAKSEQPDPKIQPSMRHESATAGALLGSLANRLVTILAGFCGHSSSLVIGADTAIHLCRRANPKKPRSRFKYAPVARISPKRTRQISYFEHPTSKLLPYASNDIGHS